jgi:hypothetical protein
MKDNTTTFPQKWSKKLPDGWSEMANSMKEDELKKVILECESSLYDNERAKEADAKLQKAKEEAKEAGAVYKDTKDTQTAKIKYALYVLEERGITLERKH